MLVENFVGLLLFRVVRPEARNLNDLLAESAFREHGAVFPGRDKKVFPMTMRAVFSVSMGQSLV